MPYARGRPFVVQPARSLFLDSEIALMLAARRVVQDRPDYRAPLTERVNAMVARLQGSPLLVAESYPDECWIFDHAIALAAIRVADFLDGTDHSALLRDWVASARAHLIEPKTGLLVSSFTTRGEVMDGPEGSTIWVTAHFLRLVDEDFAHDQYARARRELGRSLLGFAWSREWPVAVRGPQDIDSGMVIPGLDVSAGGSGLAFIAAASFGDAGYLRELHTTLDFAAFPVRESGRLRYCASNLVGDSAMLYADVLGPLWAKVQGGRK
jgi:Linalool dehydratase/isomerase